MKKLILIPAIAALLLSCKTQNQAMELPQEWKHTTNIYEVNVRQYTPEGTFSAFEKHLTRLKKMGVKTLWFMPITPIAQKNKKGSLGSPYAASDYTTINPEFGTLDDFKHLVNEAHKMGFKVIIDWVANHTGWDHVWTKTHPDWYLKDADGSFHKASGMDDIIELDYSNKEMRLAMIEAMKYWVKETNIDGFRCDLASWVEVDFWQQARPEVEKVKPLFFLGEFDELESPDYGKVFDASYSWKWMHLSQDFYQKNLPLSDLKNLLEQYSKIGDNSMRAWFTTNHDENSWNGTEYEKYGDFAPALAVFSATWNGVPLLYSGQELPMKAKRLEFFEKDPMSFGKFKRAAFYKTLLELRKRNAALSADASFKKISVGDDKAVYAFVRIKGTKKVLVILNLSKYQQTITIKDKTLLGNVYNVFMGANEVLSSKAWNIEPWGYAVYELFSK